MNRAYCTYFDHNYLPRGLALYRSLQSHAPGARLWVLCLSGACYRTLTALDLPNLVPVRLEAFEAAEPEVAATRATRNLIEYYFTCSPAWMLYVLNSEPDVEWVTYLDSDLYFFASPEPIYDEMGEAAFGIIPHRFARGLENQYRFGRYNVGWISVRRREDGIAVLRWWRERCIEWCYDHVDIENDRFADQRYLDRVPNMFPGVHAIEHLGANLAPWNLGGVGLTWQDGAVVIEGRYPLIFFHFYGVKRSGRYYFNGHRLYGAPFSKLIKQQIYEPYTAALAGAESTIAPYLKNEAPRILRKPAVTGFRDRIPNAMRKARLTVNRYLDIATGRAIPVSDTSAR